MSRKPLTLAAATALIASPLWAEAPRVAIDIAPVHSLVARVMEGVGAPDLVVAPGASPHDYSLRPSEASALQEADIVIWMGENLTPWMEGAVETLAGDATVLTLLEAEGTTLLEFRAGALFEAHMHGTGEGDDHGHDDHGHDDHGHDDHGHDDHGHDDHGHDDHGHDDHGHDDHAHDDHGHAHGAHDPHAWLSTGNAAAWLNIIAGAMSSADPGNAGAYFANAAAARAELEALTAEVEAMLAPVRGQGFIVFHDAYQYFEESFDLPASGAISLSDATDPSPARIAEIQARVAEQGVVCVLSEPQFDPGIVAAVMDGAEARTAVLDPLGSTLQPGPALYGEVIRGLAETLAACLSEG
ncbi:zinc ABC transporter solute-binding protein [Rhodobacterales bacterium HKCCSP123]|nr:zinc ABC transporter solute-binding protein [Rhodobacterales bacterium HKCCSP123]